MKKLFITLSALIISVIISLSAVGCSFFDPTNTRNVNPQKPNESSVISAQTVHLNTIEESIREKYSLEDAISAVERTSVAIEVTSGSGTGAGSGVILDVGDSGNYVYVITCHHVIESCGSIKVYIPDEKCSYENADYVFDGTIGNQIYTDKAVTLVGGDKNSDIAVIKIDLSKPAVSGNMLASSKIQKAKVPSDSYSIRKGESIFAIGNPTGMLPGSVSTGIVSFLEREEMINEVGSMQLMQISVNTNPGNSGGGLYNLYGELIGITNAGNTNYELINYAIPYYLSNGNGYLNITKQLIGSQTATNYGYVDGRWDLGITVAQRGNIFSSYIEVTDVSEGGNADLAGIQVGDRINGVVIDGVSYTFDSNAVNYLRSKLTVGDSFGINVTRKVSGSYQTISLNVTVTVANYIFCNTGN